jgi:hypothetical protein
MGNLVVPGRRFSLLHQCFVGIRVARGRWRAIGLCVVLLLLERRPISHEVLMVVIIAASFVFSDE